jgi:hypothetical protein
MLKRPQTRGNKGINEKSGELKCESSDAKYSLLVNFFATVLGDAVTAGFGCVPSFETFSVVVVFIFHQHLFIVRTTFDVKDMPFGISDNGAFLG